MTREYDQQRQLAAEQQRKDEEARVLEHLSSMMTEAVKASLILNSGALVAMLGFMQALAGKSMLGVFLQYAVAAMCLFLLGCVLAVGTFFVRHNQVEKEYITRTSSNWRKWFWYIAVGSVAAFLCGVIAVIVGMAKTF